MEQKNYYVALTYDLKVGQEDELMESTTPENPFTFYTGLGMVLEDFEKAIMACEVNGEFDFTIPKNRLWATVFILAIEEPHDKKMERYLNQKALS